MLIPIQSRYFALTVVQKTLGMMECVMTKLIQEICYTALTKIVTLTVKSNVIRIINVLHSPIKPRRIPVISPAAVMQEDHTFVEMEGPIRNVTYVEVSLSHSKNT